jgi:hypothetical protein
MQTGETLSGSLPSIAEYLSAPFYAGARTRIQVSTVTQSIGACYAALDPDVATLVRDSGHGQCAIFVLRVEGATDSYGRPTP